MASEQQDGKSVVIWQSNDQEHRVLEDNHFSLLAEDSSPDRECTRWTSACLEWTTTAATGRDEVATFIQLALIQAPQARPKIAGLVKAARFYVHTILHDSGVPAWSIRNPVQRPAQRAKTPDAQACQEDAAIHAASPVTL